MAFVRMANIGPTYSINLPDSGPSQTSGHQLDRLTTEVSEHDYCFDPQIMKGSKIQKHKTQTSSKRSLRV